MIRIAAVGDIHAGLDSAGTLRPRLETLPQLADLLLLAGDLTKCGDPAEAAVLAGELDGLPVSVIAVLGNHDHEADRPDEVADVLRDAGVHVLEGETFTTTIAGASVGVVGAKGFGGGFEGAMATEFGEREMKAFVAHTRQRAEAIDRELDLLEADVRIVLLHYAPVRATLRGEPLEIYPFLGSYMLAEPCDRAGVDLVLHGHAHRGAPAGLTPGGIPVRNVAQPVIEQPYAVFTFDVGDDPTSRRGSELDERTPRVSDPMPATSRGT